MNIAYDYYPTVLQVIDLIGQGQSRTVACDTYSLSIATFDKYVRSDPTLQEMYADAEQRGHDAMADALLNIDNDRIYGKSDPKMAKVISDNIKWVLSKRDTKRFGDRVEIKHELTMDRAIVTALEHARQRALPYSDAPVIDVSTDDERIMAELLA